MEGSLILLIRSLQIIWNSLANQRGWEMEANLLPPGCFAFRAKYVSKLEFRLLRHSPYVLCKFSIHLWSWWSCLALAGSAVQNFGWQWDLFPKHCDNVFPQQACVLMCPGNVFARARRAPSLCPHFWRMQSGCPAEADQCLWHWKIFLQSCSLSTNGYRLKIGPTLSAVQLSMVSGLTGTHLPCHILTGTRARALLMINACAHPHGSSFVPRAKKPANL